MAEIIDDFIKSVGKFAPAGIFYFRAYHGWFTLLSLNEKYT
jgi:hypothetical protein